MGWTGWMRCVAADHPHGRGENPVGGYDLLLVYVESDHPHGRGENFDCSELVHRARGQRTIPTGVGRTENGRDDR